MNYKDSSYRDSILKFIAEKDQISVDEAVMLIREYIFDTKGVRITIAENLTTDLFERAVTIACNFYSYKPKDYAVR